MRDQTAEIELESEEKMVSYQMLVYIMKVDAFMAVPGVRNVKGIGTCMIIPHECSLFPPATVVTDLMRMRQCR